MQEQGERVDELIAYLIKENPQTELQLQEDTLEEKISLFRALCNVRKPKPVSEAFLQTQDAFLSVWNGERKETAASDIVPVLPQISLWQGDITTLAADAIVNAANSELLGCFIPNHQCIDNIIHSRAGVQLRLACHELIEQQGRKESVGKAKITNAYNLPAKHVIHTVGPFIDERGVSPLKEKLLASSYRSSLALADEKGARSIAFCSISTGEFNFPNERAAEIAIATVKNYLEETESKIHVIFNVFKDEDQAIYHSLLQGEKGE